MELLYSTVVPRCRVHTVAWSGMNLVALSVSVPSERDISEAYSRASTHQLLVFDPNRPWDFHYISTECKSMVKQLDWSLDGTRLLSLCQKNVVHIWRMKTRCINSWVAAHRHECEQGSKLVHAAWLDCRPMATLNHAREDWNEVMEVQPLNPHLRMMLGEAFIMVTEKGKVIISSTHLPHCESSGGELKAEAALPGSGAGPISIAKTFVTQTGCILLGACYQGGVVKVYSLATQLHWVNQFTITASLATELHNFRESGRISALLMVPHADGCMVHVCYNSTQLYQWSVKDITRSSSYQSRREGVYSSPHPISSLVASGLCLGSHDLSMQEHKMSELLVFTEDDMKESEGKWPVELLVTLGGGDNRTLALLDRDSYKEVFTETLRQEGVAEGMAPSPKRQRLDGGVSAEERLPLLCLSPNASCVLVVRGQTLQLYQIVTPLLGLKDGDQPEVSQLSRLLSLAVVGCLSPWDLVVSTARLQAHLGQDLVHKVLQHFSADYELHSSSLKQVLVMQFFSTCSLLHMSLEQGLLPSISYRNMARLYATARLLELALCPTPSSSSPTSPSSSSSSPEAGAGSEHEQGMPRLQAVCKENKTEENLKNLADDLDVKDFALSPEMSQQLQAHCNWLLEMAIVIVSAIAEGETHVNALLGRLSGGGDTDEATDGTSDENPTPSILDLLRHLLLLVFVWNKSLPQRILPVSDGALALLFKVVTVFNLSPQPLSDELQSEVKANLPVYQHLQLLSLTKAAHLQGFLSGLCSADLPETFRQGVASPLRPQVQSHFTCLDPFSPLSLVVPKGMAPPWRDCFVDGQRDLVHGGTLSKALIQGAKLKQCSRCRSWTLASEKLAAGDQGGGGSEAVLQWRSAWSNMCLCGAPWTLQAKTRI